MKLRPLHLIAWIVLLTLDFGAGWWSRRSPAAMPLAAASVATPNESPAVAEKLAGPQMNQHLAQQLFKSAEPSKDLRSLLEVLRTGSRLKAQGVIAQEVSLLGLDPLKKWLKEMEGQPNGDATVELLRRSLLERWAELDFPGLMAMATKPADMYSNGRPSSYVAMDLAFTELAKKNPQAAWDQAKTLGWRGDTARNAILNELAEHNPTEGLRLLQTSKSPNDSYAANSFYEKWAVNDPQGAAASVDQITNTQMRGYAIQGLTATWAHKDKEGAFAWASALPKAGEKQSALAGIISASAQDNPQGALADLDRFTLGQSRSNTLSRILNTWGGADFAGALSFATTQTKFSDQRAAIQGLVQSINGDEAKTQQLMSLAKTLPAAMARSIYQGGIWQMAYTNPEKLKDWVGQIEQPSIRESALKQAAESLTQWSGSSNGELAASLFDQLQGSSQDKNTASRTASSWANDEPQKALAWATKLTNQETQKDSIGSAVRTWANSDPKAAAAYTAQMPAGEAREAAIKSLAQTWMENEPKAAQAWANGLTGTEKSVVLGAMVGKAQNQDPEAAPKAYETFVSSLSAEDAAKKDNQAVARNLASTLAQDDPKKGLAWLATLPNNGARDEAIGGIAQSWVAFDPAAASEWITALPAGKGRDNAAETLASTIARDDPSSAFAWATSISDAATRRKSAESVLENWKKSGGKDAATAALNAANFTETERTELAKKLE